MAAHPPRSASAEKRETDSAADVLDKVKAVLTPLDRTQKARLFDLIRAGYLEDDQMTLEVGRLIVSMLNGPRTEHARRLWTGWFDPILLRDDMPMLAESRLSGCLHVVDASAWWFALLPHLRDLADQAQNDIAQLASEQPLESVLTSPAALAWAEELRRRSLSLLRHRKNAGGLLAAANAERSSLLHKRHLAGVAPMGMADLTSLEGMLEHAPVWKGKTRARDAVDLLHTVSEMMERSSHHEGAIIFAQSRIHSAGDPDQALMLYRAAPDERLRDAAIGQMLLAWQCLRQKLESQFLGRPAPAQIAAGESVECLMDRAFRWYDALQGFGIGRQGREWGVIWTAVGRVTGLVEGEIIPVLTHRILALSPAASPQFLMASLRAINLFCRKLNQHGIAAPARPWLPAVGEHLSNLFRTVALAGRDDALSAVARLCEVAEEVGYPIEVTAIDKSVFAIVEQALLDAREFAGCESQLIERVVSVASAERRRCRWWLSTELQSLLSAAQARGVGVAVQT